jgi:hypothetical protein
MAKIILCFDSYQETDQAGYDYTFQGHPLHVTQGDDRYMHRVALFTDGPRHERSHIETLNRFVSALCWKYKMPVYIGSLTVFGQNGGDSVEEKKYNRIRGYGIPINLFEPSSIEQKRALGFYREALSSDSSFYSFLAFYKILELEYTPEAEIIDWINSNLPGLRKSQSQLGEIYRTKPVLNVGKRVVELRNGIAHAVGGKRPIDIDGYPNIRELNLLCFVLEELSEKVMIDSLSCPKN